MLTTRLYSRDVLFLLFLLGFSGHLTAQSAQITGRIIDENGQPLAGVNIALERTVLGAATDLDGFFIIQRAPSGSFTLAVSMIGYRTYKQDVLIVQGEAIDIGIVPLSPKPISGETVVITASKYEQELQNVPASLSLISRQEIQSRNILTIDQALKYVPGVNMNSTQMNIRGSSGYSRGVGSRVFFLIDGIPILTGDTREVSYDVIPTYLIERVEIVKGAGSALYGSSALGGVVNMITKDIDQIPHYYVKLYGGVHSNTAYPQWNWSDNSRFYNGLSGHFSRKFRKLGIQLGGAYDRDDSYRQNDQRKRYSGSGKLTWAISPYHQFTMAGNYMEQDRENFLYWKNLQYALQPPDDQIGDQVKSKRYYLSGQYRYLQSRNQLLIVRGIWFWNRFRDNIASIQTTGNESISKNLFGEIQYTTFVKQFSLTSGVSGNTNSAESNIFGNHSASSYAAYIQTEGPVTAKVRLTVGARLDYFQMDSVESDYQVNPKIGLVYSPFIETNLRTTLAWGFRAPSLAEVFTSTDASGFQVVPNTKLKPEESVYLETGIKQIFQERLTLDVAAFHSRYRNLIEGEFLASGEIQFQNITRATIWGIETALSGSLWKEYLRGNLSYTYVNPRDEETNEYLKFRPRHLFYISAMTRLAPFQFSLDYRFIKKYDRIDEKFALLIEDAEQRVDAHILDFRILWNLNLTRFPLRLTLQFNNLLRYYYVDLVGSLAPLRGITLTLESGF